jgi:hypothetical protein
MHAAPLLWMANRLRTATCSFGARLRVMPRPLLHAPVRQKRVHTPVHSPRAPRPASAYTMLVESDVQHGMRGILPSLPHPCVLRARAALMLCALPTDTSP